MTERDIAENLTFKSRKEINLEGLDKDTPVYRVYPISRLLELFTEKKNVLVKPELWDDPFENIVFQQSALLKNGMEVGFSSIKEKYYGQCWTLNQNETDALWRIYSNDKLGVRVKTTIGKLWDSFYNPNFKWAMISYYIGKMYYNSVDEIKDLLENPDNLEMIFDTSGVDSVKTLLIKRMEFEHENEIRLIYSAKDDFDDLTSKIYKYDVDPVSLIDEILFDPRFDEVDDFNQRKIEIQKLGFGKSIEKSDLYQLPKFNLRLNH